jgi:hypothetical protein
MINIVVYDMVDELDDEKVFCDVFGYGRCV